MKTRLFHFLLLTLLGVSQVSIAQTGSSSNPFTSLDQAANVSVAGFYFFDFNGNTANTFVDENGYVQIGLDLGSGVGNLPTSGSLDTNIRGVFTPLILSNLSGTKEVRISSSSDSTDVTTTHDSIIWRVQNNLSLHQGYVDTLFNSSWVGQNQDAFNTIPTVLCGPFTDDMLSQRIFHNCGAYDSFTWAPISNYQREVWIDGEVASNVKFQLWVKGNVCSTVISTNDIISSCNPITWIDGNTYSADNNTATYTFTSVGGCDSIVSLNLTINAVDISVTNNGLDLFSNANGMNYQWIDCDNSFNPIPGEVGQNFFPAQNGNFAVIVNNNGCSDTSACQLIENLEVTSNKKEKLLIYPIPAVDHLQIVSKNPILLLNIYDSSGKILLIGNLQNNHNIILDINNFKSGIYFLRIETHEGTSIHKFTKL
ncbi:MAG: hypothetical protein ACI857_001587 [Arenicella sp.]|jgi:hypothetical protein